jgi:cytochrome c553
MFFRSLVRPQTLLHAGCLAFTLANTTGALAQAGKSKAATLPELQERLAQAQADARLGDTLLATGKKVATVCANCHGPGGVSSAPDIPNLAGQHPSFLLTQIHKFAVGTRRNEFMEGMIKALNTDEKVGMTLYYSAQQPTPKPPTNPELAMRGQTLYQKNCFRCHGQDGRGSEQFARIASQQPGYLKIALTHYRNGDGVRMDPLMAANTKLLSDTDIDAITTYVASLH